MVKIAITAHFYNNFFTALATKQINLTSDTLKLALTSGYTPSQGSDQFWSTPQAFEITGTGYTAGGVTVGSIAITTSGWDFTGVNASWGPGASFVTDKAILYDATPGTAGTDILIGWIDFGTSETPTNGVFTVQWSGSGIGAITVS